MTASTPPPPGGPPRFDHDCDACVFLGAYTGPAPRCQRIDLYWCPNPSHPTLSSVLGRYGDNGSSYYSSTPPEAVSDAMYLRNAQPWYQEAIARALAAGLYRIDHDKRLAQASRHLGYPYPARRPVDPWLADRIRESFAAASRNEQRAAWEFFNAWGLDLPCPPAALAMFHFGDGEPLGDVAQPGEILIAGWDDGRRWNGWAEPLVGAAEAKRLVEALYTDDFAEVCGTACRWDEARRALIEREVETNEETIVEAEVCAHEPDAAGATASPLYRVGLGLTWCVYTCPTCDSNMVPAPAPKRATCPTCDRLRAEGIDPASMTPKEIRDADAYAH